MIIRVVRFAAIAAVLLAGCNGDAGEPSTLPDVTTTPAETPSATPAPTTVVEPPVEPANAQEYSAEGVEAFTLYAIDVINYAYGTNDVTYLKQIMMPDCQFCERTVDRLATIGDAGGRVEGGQLVPEVEMISISGPAEGVQTSAGVEMSITASTTYDGQGQIRDSQPADDLYAIFNLTREEDMWKLEEIFRAESSQSL